MMKDEGIDLTNFSIEEEIAKFKGIKPQGWTVVVRLYIEPQQVNGIYIPDTSHEDQRFQSCAGFVVGISPAAYKDSERYGQTGPWCQLGDWVIFPRHAGYIIYYEGIPLYILKEDAIDGVIDDPRKIKK